MLITTNIPKNLIEFPEDAPARIAEPKIIVMNEFEPYSCSRFTNVFNQMLREPQDVIPIQVDSPGGAIVALMGIRDLIAVSPKPVLCFTSSMAASCGAVLLSMGTKGYRYASPNSMILVHEASTEAGGKTSEIMNEALYVEKLNDELLQLLADNSNKSKDFYKKLIKKNNNADLFISPEDALSWGLIDAIGVPHLEMTLTPTYTVKNLVPEKKRKVGKSVTVGKSEKK